MSYIVVVNPLILAQAGMPGDGVLAATCLAAVFVSGVIFLALTLTRAREAVVNAIPLSLKCAIAVGIGFFIALIGLKNAGLVVFHPGTGSLGLVDGRYFDDPGLRSLLPPGTSAASIGLALAGLAVTAALVVRRVRGALLWGIAITTLLGLPLGVTGAGGGGIVSWPSGLGETFLALDFAALTGAGLLTVILTLTFVDLFDTTGTLVGLAGKAGYLDEQGRLRYLFA